MVRHQSTAPLAVGFPPIAARGARVLVLGSMPGVASLTKRQYYGHPRNAFWPIAGELFGAAPELSYRRRLTILRARGVAVWDVLKSCQRAGSLDTAICLETEAANDFATFFNRHPRIHTIFFNGQKAESAYRRHVLPSLAPGTRELRLVRLPSTSPAHAGRSLAEKIAAWNVVRDALAD